LSVLCLSQAAMSKSAYDSVHQGNELYGGGQYSEAIKSYDQALIDSPQMLEPKFDKANGYFRLDDLSQAIDLYKQVAAESRDMQLVARSKYNLGNCYFQQGLKQKDSDMRKAIEDLQTGISYWRQALDIDPHYEKAAKNIEVARLTIKDIIDQLNKQQQQQQKAQQQKQMQENLKQLLEQQKTLADKTQQTQQKADSNGVSQQQVSSDYNEIAKEQSQLKDGTKQAMEQLQPNDPNMTQPQMQQAADELDKAVRKQADAQEKLDASDGSGAKQSQDKAGENLENALKALSEGQQKGQQQQQQSRQEQQTSQKQPSQAQEPNQQAEPNQAQQQPQQEAAALDTTAQEILDKEQQQRRERQMLQSYGYQKVDKDW
jgi:Ca-activated chloride channel family protein